MTARDETTDGRPAPLSDARLAEIHTFAGTVIPIHLAPAPNDQWVASQIVEMSRQWGELLAEVDRLRAALAARDEIVRAVASLPLDDTCVIDDPEATEHAPDCWVSQARALLASTAPDGGKAVES